MVNKEKSLTGYLLGINVAHIVICCIVMLLRRYELFTTSYVRYALLALTLIVWFVFAFLSALGSKMAKAKYAFLFSFLSVVPITLIVIACFILSLFEGMGWFKFFFIGSTVNFYFRPMVSIASVINMSAYLFYAVCIVLLFIVCFIGAAIGINTDKKKDRNKNHKKENKAKEPRKKKTKPTKTKLEAMSKEAELIDENPEKTKDKKKEISETKAEILGENITEETDAELQAEIDRLKQKLEERKKTNAD